MKMTMDSWEQGIKIRFLERRIADLERQLEELSTCEICDGPVKEVAICVSCWNKMVRPKTSFKQQLAEVDEVIDLLKQGQGHLADTIKEKDATRNE